MLARVDLRVRACLEQKRGHVARQERPRLGIHYVEPVMIDQHRLLFSPVRPALPADLIYDSRADRPWKWRPLETLTRLAAASACDFSQWLRPRVLDLRQTDERKQLQVDPADIELVPLRLELRGVGIGVMIVVELLPPQPDRDR